MTLRGKKIQTIIVLVLLFCICLYGLCAAKDVQIRKEAEFGSRYELWQARNPEVEKAIKGYIDDIDWGYYIKEFSEALANPVQTTKDLYEYYGAE